MSLSGSLVDSSLPHPIMHIQSNLRPGVIDGAPLIWPGCTSASRFTTVATGRLAQAVAKTDTCTILHSLVFLSPFHSHSCTIMRIHIRIQRPPSCKQIYATPSLSLSPNKITQHKTWTRGNILCTYYTPNIISIHRHALHKHTHSLYPPPF